jgi:serine/threonine-protein kinase RsbW
VISQRSFGPEAASVRAARQFVLAAAGGAAPRQRDAISVMVSELAMNAVQYARTAFGVSVERTGESLRVAVTDSGGGDPQAQPLPSASSLHGRGLFIVGQLSDEWGISPAAGAGQKTVWFRLAMQTAAGNRA